MKVHIRHDSQHVSYLIGDILHQFSGVRQARDSAPIVPADMENAPFRIGEAAYPLQIFIMPRLFVFGVLIFRHKHPPRIANA